MHIYTSYNAQTKNEKDILRGQEYSLNDDLVKYQLYLKRKGISDRSIYHNCRMIKKVLINGVFDETLFTTYIVDKNPAVINKYCSAGKHWCDFKNIPYDLELFKRVREKSKTRLTFSEKEILSFLKIKTSYSPFWYIVALHGFRPGEVIDLRVQNIDMANKSISIPQSKTGTGRTVSIHPLALEVISNLVEKRQDRLFTFTTEGAYRHDFHKRIKILGITKPVVPYSFRHSFATRLLSAEAPLFAVQDMLGHADPKTTRVYYHGNLVAQDKAIQKDPILSESNRRYRIVKMWEELRDVLEKTQGIKRENILKVESALYDCIIDFKDLD